MLKWYSSWNRGKLLRMRMPHEWPPLPSGFGEVTRMTSSSTTHATTCRNELSEK